MGLICNIFTPFEGSSGSYFERPQHVDILQVGTREHTLILSFAQYKGTFDTKLGQSFSLKEPLDIIILISSQFQYDSKIISLRKQIE